MRAHQTRREIEILRRMAEIEKDPEAAGELYREGESWWIDADRCTRTARTLLFKGLVTESDPGRESSYASLSEWGRLALSDRTFISPFVYLATGVDIPESAKRLLNPGDYRGR